MWERHTGRAALCFTGHCAPESLASCLDAPVERWIFQEKLQQNQTAYPSGVGGQVGSTFYYLSNTAHLWTTTHKTLWVCHVGFYPKLKQELTACLQASFQPHTKNQISNQQTDNPERSKGHSRDLAWWNGLCLNHFPSPDIWYDC